jgi:hypothetical protein
MQQLAKPEEGIYNQYTHILDDYKNFNDQIFSCTMNHIRHEKIFG